MHKKNLYPYYKLFDRAPIPAAILHADTLKLEMANSPMLELWDRPPAVIGTPLLEFMPELEEQSYPDYLKQVCHTGAAHEEKGARVLLKRKGKTEHVYMDYSYTPIFGECKKATGILVMAKDVCDREKDKFAIEQAKRDLRSMVLAAPVAMCVYRGANFNIEIVNDHMLDLWQETRKMKLSILNHVFHNGLPYSVTEDNLSYSCTPIGHHVDDQAGVWVVAIRK
jgi:PAS domain-containing protein